MIIVTVKPGELVTELDNASTIAVDDGTGEESTNKKYVVSFIPLGSEEVNVYKLVISAVE